MAVPLVTLRTLLVIVMVGQVSAVFCRAGQYYSREFQICRSCESGTFMSHDKHQLSDCFKCQQPDEHNFAEYVAEKCTSKTNTVIRCIDGYFFHIPGDPLMHQGSCNRCRSCDALGQYVAKECDATSDAVCCPNPNMVLSERRNEFGGFICEDPSDDSPRVPEVTKKSTEETCVSRIGGCERNERLASLNPGNEAVCCEPCPKDTFVSESRHTRSTCQSCWSEDGTWQPECSMENSTETPVPTQRPDSIKPTDESRNDVSMIVGITLCIVFVVFIGVSLAVLRFKKSRQTADVMTFNSPVTDCSEDDSDDSSTTTGTY